MSMFPISREAVADEKPTGEKHTGEKHAQVNPNANTNSVRVDALPAHSFPAASDSLITSSTANLSTSSTTEISAECPLDRNPDLWMYRRRTMVLLHRYLRYSLETGRIPSILGREFFRSAVTSYTVTTFEDRVLFVHDVEVCLQKLAEFSQQVIARVVLEEHSHGAAARLLHCSRRKLERELFDALDRLSELFLEVELLVDHTIAREQDANEIEIDDSELEDEEDAERECGDEKNGEVER
jgi:hypothetical protein